MRREKNKGVLITYKPLGKTPLDMVRSLKEKDPSLRDLRVGYAGRLDPMAEGILLLLVGEENKEKKKYENLEKVYVLEILLGFSSDTYDILGKIISKKTSDVPPPLVEIKTKLKSFEGKFDQEYPPYSSKTVDGKPLYFYARHDLLSEIKIPKRKVEIFEVDNISSRKIKGSNLLKSIEEKIALVSGDFRQKEILTRWREALGDERDKNFEAISLRVKCSGGTYMRSLAYNFGKKIGIPSLAISIKRLSVGDFKLG